MTEWVLIGLIVLVVGLYVWVRRKRMEGFVDVPTLQAQRQMLQWEGERRYNDLARIQAPRNIIPSDQVAAAVQQTVPVPTSFTSSLLTLLGVGQLSAADDGTGKQGAGVEQTGMVQEKINFCESIKSLDCKQLDDPRLAECGICLDGGKDSKGNFHRGGMYISSADQISTNERAGVEGAPAAYKPTVGSCPPKNFVLMRENCKARAAQLHCIRAGAPTDSNVCGQCFGAAPGGFQGLLYTVPPGQKKPLTYPAVLNVSHPGTGNSGGAGLIVLDQNGKQLGALPPSNQVPFAPAQLTLTLYEGQQISIQIFGAPQVWCGWLSNPAGNRTVGLDIGMQTITPTGAFEIVGDKNAGPVQSLVSAQNMQTWAQTVPNTVLWYIRRNEIVPGAIIQAWYGTTPANASTPIGYDATAVVQMAGTAGSQQFTVSNTIMAQATGAPVGGDPAPDITKHLWITYDTGNNTILTEGSTVPGSQIGNALTLALTVPASLVDPLLKDDLAACPTGPMILTPTGAGLMSSHSCYTAKGEFNPVPYCLQELFQSAGGTPQGAGYPNTQEQATALVQKDPTTGKPSMDATMAYLNNLGTIANSGVDATGKMVPFSTFQSAMLTMLGVKPSNPCQGPTQNTGPHSPECLDYLYRTSGNPAQDSVGADPSTLPYAFCAANGSIAPLNADGSVNQGNVSLANQYGSATGVRNFYQGVYGATQDSSNFENQAQAMGQCFGATILPPPADPTACPPPNPTDWQCYTPEILQAPEVFQIGGGAENNYAFSPAQASTVCAQAGARLATPDEITAAQAAGAQWCSCGWAADGNAYYPMQQGGVTGCGGPGTVSCGNMSWSAGTAAATCFGVKPPQGTNNILPFSATTGAWNQPQPGSAISDTAVPAIRQVAPNSSASTKLECASTDGQSCYMFGSLGDCQAWTTNPSSNPAINQTAQNSTASSTSWSSGGQIIQNSTTGGVFWVDQNNVAHEFTSCIPCADGYNVCNNISQTQPGSAFDPVSGIYTQGPNFRCGHDGTIDRMLRAQA